MTTRVTITNSTDANTANAYPNEHHIEIFESFPTQEHKIYLMGGEY